MATVDQYIFKHTTWQKELEFLRMVVQKTPLKETIKWGAPVYTFEGKNIVAFAAFKNYVGLWFYQGVFLKDERKLLINAQEGKTQALRQWRFNSIDEMDLDLISSYLLEAIENQKQGKGFKPKKKPLIIPKELQTTFEVYSSLGKSFESLTLTKKRDFCTYISEAKQLETKKKRLAKIIPMIGQGIGLNDKYKK
jgi:uncharacterized protein YdeI (YjbR/CyaY-like superfamily)